MNAQQQKKPATTAFEQRFCKHSLLLNQALNFQQNDVYISRYISFGIYVIVCNLLIFNMIISIFCLKTNSIKIETEKAFSFKRYLFIKEYSRKTIFPAPLALIEYIVRFFRVLVNLCNGQMFVEYNSFGKTEFRL